MSTWVRAETKRDGLCGEPQSSDAGFTLVEVLVSLALLAVMSSLMVAFVGQTRAIKRLHEASISEGEVLSELRFLEHVISSAEPYVLPNTDPTEGRYLKGTGTGLEFTGIIPTGFRTASLRSVTLAIRHGGDTNDAIELLTNARFQNDPLVTPIELLSGVRELKFTYYSAATGEWQPHWSAKRALPAAVGISVTVTRNGKDRTISGLALIPLGERVQELTRY